jgi:hypothetical protein
MRVPDWPGFLKSVCRLLKPGGWVQIFEVSTVYTDDKTSPWYPASLLHTGMHSPGEETTMASSLSQAELYGITTASERLSIDVEDYLNGIYAELKWTMHSMGGFSKDEIDKFLDNLKASPSEAGVGL